MGNGKRQEVAIGDLAGAQHQLPTDEALVQQTDVLMPEDVAGVVAGFLEPWPSSCSIQWRAAPCIRARLDHAAGRSAHW